MCRSKSARACVEPSLCQPDSIRAYAERSRLGPRPRLVSTDVEPDPYQPKSAQAHIDRSQFGSMLTEVGWGSC